MFNETPEYLQQRENEYKEYVANIQHKYGKDYPIFSELEFDDSDEDLESIMKYMQDKKNTKDEIGIVRGLAWTSVGGVTLEIEVNVMPGKGELKLTGKLA